MSESAVVYRVRRKPARFRGLRYVLSGDDLPEVCRDLYGLPVEQWPVPEVLFDDGGSGVPDFWWLFSAGTFALDLDLADSLQPFVAIAGELLPLADPAGELHRPHALNLLNVVDALDLSRSDPEQLIIYPDFITHRLGEPTLFMVPQLLGMFFCVEWEGDDSLKRRIEVDRLTGLRFDEVWTSTSGARPVNLMRAEASAAG